MIVWRNDTVENLLIYCSTTITHLITTCSIMSSSKVKVFFFVGINFRGLVRKFVDS
jgi:hypothetical protein